MNEDNEPTSVAAPATSPDGAVDANKAAKKTKPAEGSTGDTDSDWDGDDDKKTSKTATPDVDLTKYVTADDLKVTLADTMKAALAEAFKPLEARIAEMEKRAAPGGPAVVRRQLDGPDSGVKALLQKRADSMQALLNHPDPRVAQDARMAIEKLAL